LTDELSKANQTITFLSTITGQNPDLIKANLGNLDFLDQQVQGTQQRLKRVDSAVTTKLNEDSVQRQFQRSAASNMNNAANETKDQITSRIIQTVNMMKEVLQGNQGLRETIQK